nr:hypothetical protein [Tanacetum cinerariifolium]
MTQWVVSSISTVLSWSSNIGSESFWPSVLLLMGIIHAIVMDVLVVVAVIIIARDIPFIFKLLLMIVGISLMELSASAIVAVCVSRAAATLSATSFLMAAGDIVDASNVDDLLGGILST